MNKAFFLISLASLMFSGVAGAENKYMPYVGADVSYHEAKTRFSHQHYAGMFVNLGTTYNKYFGTEIFYNQTLKDTKKIGANDKYKTSYRAYGLDAIASMPLCSKFDLTASLGLGSYVFGEKKTGLTHASDEGVGYRFGAGGVYHLTSRVDIRANVRYVKIDHVSNLKHLSEYVLGARYFFGKE